MSCSARRVPSSRRVPGQPAAGRGGRGARRRGAREPEIGWRRVEVTAEGRIDPLMGPLAPAFEVFEWHSYEAPLPPGGVALAHTPVCLQAFRVDGLPAWGLQFHAEVTLRDLGSWLDELGRGPRRGGHRPGSRAAQGRERGSASPPRTSWAASWPSASWRRRGAERSAVGQALGGACGPPDGGCGSPPAGGDPPGGGAGGGGEPGSGGGAGPEPGGGRRHRGAARSALPGRRRPRGSRRPRPRARPRARRPVSARRGAA